MLGHFPGMGSGEPDPLGWRWTVAVIIMMIPILVVMGYMYADKGNWSVIMGMVFVFFWTFVIFGLRFLMGWYYGK